MSREDRIRRVHTAAENFQFRRLANPITGIGQIADRGRRALRRLAEWGVAVPKGCRLERAAEFIEASRTDEDAMAAAGDAYLTRIGESTRTIVELYLATHARNEKPAAIVLEKLLLAVQGADTPSEERSHAARDAQWELYVWGMMTATAVPCDFIEPPDLVIDYGREKLAIAAKRVWSQEQARKRVSEAADQIEQSRLRGFIAVNAQEYLTDASAGDDLRTKGEEFNRDLSRLHGHLPYLAKKPHVLGLIVGGTVYRWTKSADGTRRIAFSNFHQLLVLTEDDDGERSARQFADAQGSALGTWIRDNM